MKLPLRIVIPIGSAVLCAATLAAILWWQTMSTKSTLLHELANIQSPTGGKTNLAAQIVTQAGGDALTHLHTGDLFALEGKWSQAQESYENAVKAGGGLPALRKLVQAQLQKRDFRRVRITVQELRRAGAKEEDLLLIEAIAALRSGELQKTRDILRDASDSPQKHYAQSLLSIVEGNHDEAKQQLDLVITGWEPVLRAYGKTLKSAYDEYALFPESPNIHLITLIARALAEVQECELALPLLTQVTEQQNDYRDAWIVLGYCALTTERLPEALASFEQAYALDPQKSEIQYFLGRTYALQGNHGNAITFLRYALANGFEPQEQVRTLLASSALDAGQTELALEQFAALSATENAPLEIFAKYALLASEMGKAEDALEVANNAVQKWPESAQAFSLLGQVHAAIGNIEAARSAFEEALKKDPDTQSAKEGLRTLP